MFKILILFISVFLVNISVAIAEIDSFEKAEPLIRSNYGLIHQN